MVSRYGRYNDDPDDITVHYRVYKSPYDDCLHVVCVQNFDYPDYDEDGFIDPTFYLNEAEAERKVLQLENPDDYIPGLYDAHYRLYQNDDDEKVVVTIDSEYDYENYVSTNFLNDVYYEDWQDADTVLWWSYKC